MINNFRVSKEIAEKLGVDNKMALLMSKGKLISISKDHGITGEQFEKPHILQKLLFMIGKESLSSSTLNWRMMLIEPLLNLGPFQKV